MTSCPEYIQFAKGCLNKVWRSESRLWVNVSGLAVISPTVQRGLYRYLPQARNNNILCPRLFLLTLWPDFIWDTIWRSNTKIGYCSMC